MPFDPLTDIDALPTDPGCYLMKDATGKVMYVGKAKNLRKRISSYFHKGRKRRSGEKRSGSGKHSGMRFDTAGETPTSLPAGTVQPL